LPISTAEGAEGAASCCRCVRERGAEEEEEESESSSRARRSLRPTLFMSIFADVRVGFLAFFVLGRFAGCVE